MSNRIRYLKTRRTISGTRSPSLRPCVGDVGSDRRMGTLKNPPVPINVIERVPKGLTESDIYIPLTWQQQKITDFTSMLCRQDSRAAIRFSYRETADLKNSLIDFLTE